jgi:hypothetical protein
MICSFPVQTLRLVFLVSLIIKTKRIAERSAIVTHRQSTLDKYMIETRVAYNGEQNRLKINKNTVETGKNILILEMGFSMLTNVDLHENLKKY